MEQKTVGATECKIIICYNVYSDVYIELIISYTKIFHLLINHLTFFPKSSVLCQAWVISQTLFSSGYETKF